MARSIRAAGGRPGDLVHVAYGYGLFTGGLGAHYGAERLGCTVVPISGGMTERQVQLIADFEPRVIMVTPSYFLAILDEMERQGIDPRASSLEVGIFGAEPWTDEMRASVEERSGIRAVDIYGLSEVMGPGVSQESGTTQDGLHVWEDHFLPEIIDPVTGAVLPDGEEGELVFTSLTKQAMPVVRYRTRDLTRLLPGTAYPAFRRMQKVTGRTDDLMIVRGVNVFPSQIEEQLLTIEGLTPHYLCVLERPGNLDELTVQVEAAPGVTRPRRARRPARRPDQAADRGDRRRRGGRARRAGALAGQGGADQRPALRIPPLGWVASRGGMATLAGAPATEERKPMATLTSGPVEIHYEDTGGDGRPVVLIHGWPLSGASWSEQVPALTDAGYRVVTYDRRGFGQSGKPGTDSSYDYDTLTGDLDALMTELDLRDASLVGFSMGGGEVARYVGTYGEDRVRSIVLAAAIPPNLLKDDDHPDGALTAEDVAGLQGQLRADKDALPGRVPDRLLLRR